MAATPLGSALTLRLSGPARAPTPAVRAPGRGWWAPMRRLHPLARNASEGATQSEPPQAEGAPAPAPQTPPAIPAALLRKAAAAGDAMEALDLLAEGGAGPLGDPDCRAFMGAALDRGNVDLALSVFRAMTAAAAGGGPASAASLMSMDPAGAAPDAGALAWSPATTGTAAALVIGLCRALRTREAAAVVAGVRSRGLPVTEDVQFGYVVDAPYATGAEAAGGRPLAVLQPQEGVRAVIDAFSRYEYELYSGTVVSVSSESLVGESGTGLAPLLGGLVAGNAFAQRWGVPWRPTAAAVHTAVVQTPGGQQRTFRFGTPTADVPARQGDRVTLVCAPQRAANRRVLGLLSAAPPETAPGEPLSLTNHTLDVTTPLARPPKAGLPGGLPGWVLPATAALVAADAASSLINPLFPYLVAGGVVSTAATVVAAQKIALPRLKQLPPAKTEVQATRQRLLGQHAALERRVAALAADCEEDVRLLARLWQLQAKMGAVGGASGGDESPGGGGTYDARLERVVETRQAIEGRLGKRLEMVDAYAKVISMIEIEVEMEAAVPAAEVEAVEVQVAKLAEIEEMQAEWQLQAEAQDQVERLLRMAP